MKQPRRRLGPLMALTALSACASVPAPGGPTPLTSGQLSAVVPDSYRLTPGDTRIGFVVSPMGLGEVRGDFGQFDATLTVADAARGDVSLSAIVEAASVTVSNTMIEGMVRGPGWFDVEQYPTASFDGRLIGWSQDGWGQVEGELTIRDITRTEAFQIQLSCEGLRACPENGVRFDGELVIDRGTYGMTRMAGMVGRDVRLLVSGMLSPGGE